jgi:8-amino-7-oxononanoate synthase
MKPVHFAGNDYLGLARDPRIAKAACCAARRYGFSTGAGRWSIGWSELHQRLEEALEHFFQTEDACIQGAAYICGPAFFAAAAEEHDTVFCDENSHPNLFLGMRGAGFHIETYQHLDVEDLRTGLAAHKGRQPIVASDGLFGISGEIAPLAEIVEVAQKYGAMLFIDDAHGVFCVGTSGRGCQELFSPTCESLVFMGSMSKALGVYGGFIAGSRRWIERIRHAVNYVGSTPPPFPVVAACLKALSLVASEPQTRKRMRRSTARLRKIANDFAVPVVSDAQGPIVTMSLSDATEAKKLAAELNSHGLLLKYLDYPSEPRKNLLRVVARPLYTDEHFHCFSEILERFSNNPSGDDNR